MAPTDPTRDPSTQSSHANNPSSNWLEEFVDWLESLDVPKMNTYQKCLVGLVLTTVLLVVVTTFTGHFYLAAVAFSKAIDGMSMFGLTATLFCVVATAEVVGVNTTMLALAVGYVYGRRFDDVGHATLVLSIGRLREREKRELTKYHSTRATPSHPSAPLSMCFVAGREFGFFHRRVRRVRGCVRPRRHLLELVGV